VGYNPDGREVDDATVTDAVVVVESRDAVLASRPAGSNDIQQPIEAGLIGPDHIRAEIGELVTGTVSGRTSPEEITLYKSVGVAVQDTASVALVLSRAEGAGVGTEIEL
jgi:ornithine cyclodeaminase